MKKEHSSECRTPDSSKSLEERFVHRPQIFPRLRRIADLMEEAIAEGCPADQAAEMAIEQVGQPDAEILGDVAQNLAEQSVAEARANDPRLIRHGR